MVVGGRREVAAQGAEGEVLAQSAEGEALVVQDAEGEALAQRGARGPAQDAGEGLVVPRNREGVHALRGEGGFAFAAVKILQHS